MKVLERIKNFLGSKLYYTFFVCYFVIGVGGCITAFILWGSSITNPTKLEPGSEVILSLPFRGGEKNLWSGSILEVSAQPIILEDGKTLNIELSNVYTQKKVWGETIDDNSFRLAEKMDPNFSGSGWIRFTIPENEQLRGKTINLNVKMIVIRPEQVPYSGTTTQLSKKSKIFQGKFTTSASDYLGDFSLYISAEKEIIYYNYLRIFAIFGMILIMLPLSILILIALVYM